MITNTSEATLLNNSLNDPAKNPMSEISVQAWTAIYTYFKVPNACAKVTTGYISGSNLPCLGVLWKYYVPPNACPFVK